MQVLVAYESRGGRTRREGVRVRGSEARLRALKDTTAEDVERSDAIALGTWVEGLIFFKVGPAKAALAGVKRLPALGGKPVAVFCTYGVNPRATARPARAARA